MAKNREVLQNETSRNHHKRLQRMGGPLTVCETEARKVVASVTGGSIHPLAEKIADLLEFRS